MSERITRARLATLEPLEAAALWQVQQDHGSLVEAGLFQEWLEQDQRHQEAWETVSDAWGLFDDVDDPTFAALRSAALADRPETRWYDLRRQWQPAAAAAAVVFAVIAGGLEINRRSSPSGPQVASTAKTLPAMRVFETASEGREYALADGTRMALGADARVRVLLTADRRRIALDHGSVTLAVAHDAARPFEVAALERRIIDVGTRFQVTLKPGSVSVALYEGAVQVEGGAQTAVLRPGQQLLARPGRQDVITPIAASDTGSPELVEFDNVTLATAAERINLGSAIKLVVPDPNVARMRVSGRFHAGDPKRFARSVSVLLSLKMVQVGPTGVELRRAR